MEAEISRTNIALNVINPSALRFKLEVIFGAAITSPFNSFKSEINRVFDDFFSLTPSNLFDSEWNPVVDVEETDKEIHVTAEVPGIDEKDLNVTLENNILTISGEKTEEKEEKKKKSYIYTERKYGSFSRLITLPEGVKGDQIKAKFKKGVLEIVIPKDESAQPKKIQIDVH